ncbi:MAG: peptidoglycan DD-metalloendopeptidase family protein [Aquificaceae bacterium]
MRPLILLFLIFLSGCGIVRIEIRDKTPTTKQDARTAPQEKKRETPRAQQEKPDFVRVPMPVRGKASPKERGYYINTSCDEFFRSVSDGRVLYAGNDIGNYRWVVMVEGKDDLVYVYAMADSLFVKRGEVVRRWQVLGKVGSNREGCGLLFEIRDKEGRPIRFEFML